ncbi:hypothetical protein [Desulfolucanica intricata]|uniref:hypothetical protein n=1 Tax=Desulfolucanica intricata TaxID=1285191 RepID=UPI000830F7FA|nr:hypothetical protein [Desulfolucanica intricata]
MIINIEKLRNSLKKIEEAVGTEWLEKWVHEIKSLEFNAAPTKNYQDFMSKIPPMAVIWCKAQDELTMMSITGDLKLKKVLLKGYEIGENLVKCSELPDLDKLIDLLKSNDMDNFKRASYSLFVAAGYTGLGYKLFGGNPLIVDYKGTAVQVFCQACGIFTQKDLELHRFWYVLSTELGRRLTFYRQNRAVLITAREDPKIEDVMGIIKEVSSNIAVSENQVEINLDINSKYMVKLTALEDIDKHGNKLRVPRNYEFGMVIGSSVVAFNLAGGSDREKKIIEKCRYINELADKKIPTILYVDIPVSQTQDINVLIKYYSEQIKIKHILNLENLSKIIISGHLSEFDQSDLNYLYKGDSIDNSCANVQLPRGFIPYIPGH